MSRPLAVNLLLLHRRTGSIQRIILDPPQPLRILRVARVGIGTSDEIVVGAVKSEVLVALAAALGSDGDVGLAWVDALDPRHIVVRSSFSYLIANGDGALGHGGGEGETDEGADQLHCRSFRGRNDEFDVTERLYCADRRRWFCLFIPKLDI